jgi:hypothetical protein
MQMSSTRLMILVGTECVQGKDSTNFTTQPLILLHAHIQVSSTRLMILVGTECVEGKDYMDSIKECYDQSVLFFFRSSSFLFIYFFLFFLGVRRGQGLHGLYQRMLPPVGRSMVNVLPTGRGIPFHQSMLKPRDWSKNATIKECYDKSVASIKKCNLY